MANDNDADEFGGPGDGDTDDGKGKSAGSKMRRGHNTMSPKERVGGRSGSGGTFSKGVGKPQPKGSLVNGKVVDIPKMGRARAISERMKAK
jgi:hypothetical protein